MSRARSLPECWNHGLALAMDAVRVNTVSLEVRRGVSLWHKQRRLGMGAVILVGNVFLHLSRSRIRMHPSISRWRAGELASFALLHPGRLAEPCGGRAVALEALPGERLDRLLQQGRLTPNIMEAAARELHRAHRLTLPGASRAWSHGDAHLKNLLYDEAEQRAWLIDFETAHDTSLDASERHADDLLVLLLDLGGRAPQEPARALAEAFLRAYPEQTVRRELMSRLCPPRGLERALWKSRSHHLPDEALIDWLEYLRAVVAEADARAAAPSAP
ncbi:phosphotransferase [Myxococcus xanthus]|uniref:phosphotransferase n=1 Tax=Myxococcus xanthus TaxID=34 RepID=UPI001F32A1AD|nr:phosphotransferase [Myxococcus xanthus]